MNTEVVIAIETDQTLLSTVTILEVVVGSVNLKNATSDINISAILVKICHTGLHQILRTVCPVETGSQITFVEVVELAVNFVPEIPVHTGTVVVSGTLQGFDPDTICQLTILLKMEFHACNLEITGNCLVILGVEVVPFATDRLPAIGQLTDIAVVPCSIYVEHTSQLGLSNINALLAEVVVVTVDLLDTGQTLAFDIVCKAAVLVDPTFLQDIDQGKLIGDFCIGVTEVATCIRSVSRVTVGIDTKYCLALGLLSEAVQAAGAHVHLIADVAGGHSINLGNILPHTVLGSQLEALDEAQGICGSLVNHLALLDPSHGHSQRVGGLIKLQGLQLEVLVQDIQFAVIHFETIIEVNGRPNPGQITDTLCQAQQESPGSSAFHRAAGQHIGQICQTLRHGDGGHIHSKGVGSDHILGRIDNIVDVTVFDLGVGYLTVPCQHAVAAGGLIKVKVVFALLIQHDIDGCLRILIQRRGDGQSLHLRLSSHEGKAVHGTCTGNTQGDGNIIGVDGNGLACESCTQRQHHAGSVDYINLVLFEVQQIGVGHGHQLVTDHLAVQHQIDINLAHTLAGEYTVCGDGCPGFITDSPGCSLRDVHSVASRADTGSGHLHGSIDGSVIVLALDHSMVKLGGAGSGGVEQQIGGNITGVAVGGTVHNGQFLVTGLACHEGGGAAAIQVNCNHTASFLHDVANILQACTGGEGSLTAINTHQNHSASSGDTDRGTRCIGVGCVADNLAVLDDKLAKAADCFLDPRLHGFVILMITHVGRTIIQDCEEACIGSLGIPLDTVHNHQAAGSRHIGHIIATGVGGDDHIEVLDVVLAFRIAVAVLGILCGAGNGIVLPFRILGSTGIAVVVVDPQANILTGHITGRHIVNDLLAIGIGGIVDLLGDAGSQNLGLRIEDRKAGITQIFDIVTGNTTHLICKCIADGLTQLSQLLTLCVVVTGTLQRADQLVAGIGIVHRSTQVLTGAQAVQTVAQQIGNTLLQTQAGLIILAHQLSQIARLIAVGDQLVCEVISIQVGVQVRMAEGTGRTGNFVREQIIVADVLNLLIQGQICRNTKLIGGAQQIGQVANPAADVGVVLAALVVVGHVHGAEEVATQDRSLTVAILIVFTMGIGNRIQLLQAGDIDPDIDLRIGVDGVLSLLNELQEVLVLRTCHDGPGTGGVVGNAGTHVVQNQAQGIGTGILLRVLRSHQFQIFQVGNDIRVGLVGLDVDLGDLDVALRILTTEFTGLTLVLLQGSDCVTQQTVVMGIPADGSVSCLLGISVHPGVLQHGDVICIIVTIQAVACTFLVADGVTGCGDFLLCNDPAMVSYRNLLLRNHDLTAVVTMRAFREASLSTGSRDSGIHDDQVILPGIEVRITTGTCRSIILAGHNAVPVVAQGRDDFLGNPELVTLLALPAGGHAVLGTGGRDLLSNGNTEVLLFDDHKLGLAAALNRTLVLHAQGAVAAMVTVLLALIPNVSVGIDGQLFAARNVITAGTGHIRRLARCLTGRSLTLVEHFIMAQSGNFHTLRHMTADCAGLMLLTCEAGRPGGGDPAAVGVLMVIAQVALQQSLCNGIGHHLVALLTGMDTIAAKICHIVVLLVHIVQATQQVQVDHCDIVKCCHFDDRITQITQGIAAVVGNGLIPVADRHILPGSDHGSYEIELGITQAVGILQLHDPLAPHLRCAINGGSVSGVDVAQLIHALGSSNKVIDTHGNGDNISAIELFLGELADVAGAGAIGRQSGSADAQTDVVHAQLVSQQLDIVRLVLGDTNTNGDAVADGGNGQALVSVCIQPQGAVGSIAAGALIISMALDDTVGISDIGQIIVVQSLGQFCTTDGTVLCGGTGSLCTGRMALGRNNPAALSDLMLTGCVAVIIMAGGAVEILGVTCGSTGCFHSRDGGHGAGMATGQNGDLGVFVLLCLADGALLVLDTGLQNGGFLIGLPLPLVAQRCSQLLAANGTNLSGLTSGLCTGDMTQSCNQLLTTDGTNLSVLTVSCCAGGMAQCGDFHIGGVVAARANLIGFVADLGTGGSLCLMGSNIVTQSRNLLGIRGLTTVTGKGLDASFLTSCSLGHFLNIGGVRTSPDAVDRGIGNNTQVVGSLDKGTVGIFQFGSNHINGNILDVLFNNICHVGLLHRTGLHDDGAGTVDIGVASGGVNLTCGQVSNTVDFHISVLFSALHSRCRCRILQVHVGLTSGGSEGASSFTPGGAVIDKDLVAAAQGNLGILADDQLCTGSQGDVLSHRHITAVHIDGHVTVDGQGILAGVHSFTTSNTKLHGDRQALDGHIAVHVDQ